MVGMAAHVCVLCGNLLLAVSLHAVQCCAVLCHDQHHAISQQVTSADDVAFSNSLLWHAKHNLPRGTPSAMYA